MPQAKLASVEHEAVDAEVLARRLILFPITMPGITQDGVPQVAICRRN